MSKHTPYYATDTLERGGINIYYLCYVMDSKGKEVAEVRGDSHEKAKANAEFIVKAANNFERLVEALREALSIANAPDDEDLRERETKIINWIRTSTELLTKAEVK